VASRRVKKKVSQKMFRGGKKQGTNGVDVLDGKWWIVLKNAFGSYGHGSANHHISQPPSGVL